MKIKIEPIEKFSKTLIVKEGEKHLWKLFHPFHYMTSNQNIKNSLPCSSRFYTFYWKRDNKEILIGCLGVINQISKHPSRRVTRMVVLPEFQGLGFASKMLNSIGRFFKDNLMTLYISTYHPRLGSFFEKSEQWEPSANNMVEFKKNINIPKEHELSDTLRDGEAMFRYHFVGDRQKLIHNPLRLNYLRYSIKRLKEDASEYKKLESELKVLESTKYYPKLKEMKELKVTADWHLKAKEENKNLFGRNKRIPLSKEERKKLKNAKKEKL
jgi:GNAT superfamily N-acetyltransferase